MDGSGISAEFNNSQARRLLMPRILITLTVLVLAAGCANTGKKNDNVAANPGLTPAVTDISPTPSQASFAPPAAQAPVQPVIADNSASTPAGGKYTVKKGDTLWKIASAHYGNGNQWQKIASANPGLSAETLKAGQRIVVP
jgi:nucleoid-associated protein YgaU